MKEVISLPESMSRGIAPQWYARQGYVAHLMTERAEGPNVQTLCHMTERLAELSAANPWDRRCAQCRERVAKAFEAITAPPPAFVRETLTVVVVRPANASETAAATAKRKLGQMKSWHSLDVTVTNIEALENAKDDAVCTTCKDTHSRIARYDHPLTVDES